MAWAMGKRAAGRCDAGGVSTGQFGERQVVASDVEYLPRAYRISAESGIKRDSLGAGCGEAKIDFAGVDLGGVLISEPFDDALGAARLLAAQRVAVGNHERHIGAGGGED